MGWIYTVNTRLRSLKFKNASMSGRVAAATAAKLLHSCPTLCDPIDGSPPGSPVSGILLARTLEWVAISLSNASKWKVKVKSLSRLLLLATPWTAAHQAPLSMGFSRQEYWSGVPLPQVILKMISMVIMMQDWILYELCLLLPLERVIGMELSGFVALV